MLRSVASLASIGVPESVALPSPVALLTSIAFLALAALAGLPGVGGIQRSLAQEIDEGGYRLTLQELPDLEHGTAAVLQGQAGAEGDKFFVEQLAITQPVTVVLMAPNPAQPLTLNLSKYRFDQSDRLGETGETGAVSFDLRTQGELKIHVKPKNPDPAEAADYFLIVWAGDDLQPDDLNPPVVLATDPPGGGSSPNALILVLVLLAAGAAVWFVRKRRAA